VILTLPPSPTLLHRLNPTTLAKGPRGPKPLLKHTDGIGSHVRSKAFVKSRNLHRCTVHAAAIQARGSHVSASA